MISKDKLIIDSGGTRTDCCLLTHANSPVFFTTESYHPSHFSSSFFEKMHAFWNTKLSTNVDIYFYGAGCSISENKELLNAHFEKITPGNICIESDVLGACRAAFQDQAGILGIMGTGSVAVQYDGHSISKQVGGLGYLLGDEGSGYMAGKRIIHAFLSDKIPLETVNRWPDQLKNRSYILSQVYSEQGKKFISSFAEKLPESPYINEIHAKNISDFLEEIFQTLKVGNLPVAIIGSYGFYHSKAINLWFEQNNFQFPTMIQFPIEKLASFHSKIR